MTVAEHLQQARQRLAGCSDSARADAELILSHVLQVSRGALFARDRDAVDDQSAKQIEHLLQRREGGEPVSYLIGSQGFWTLDLQVSPQVLIPRPETETLVAWAIELTAGPGDKSLEILDLGTGSGSIALALASERPDAQVWATDASESVLEVARCNALRAQLANVNFASGSWFEALGQGAPTSFDLIVSNPPYIAQDDAHLQALSHEPMSALVSGADGLDDLRHIVSQAARYLKPGAYLLLEHGHDQGRAVRALFSDAGFAEVETRLDFGQRERITAGRRVT